MFNSILSLIFPIQSIQKLIANEDDKKLLENIETEIFTKSLLFLGDNSLFKTSLLFQSCLSSASSNRSKDAVYICKQELSSLPLFVHNMPKPDSGDLLKQIKFKYLKTSEELIEYFAGIHLNKSAPSIIVIEDIIDYINIQKYEQELDCIRQSMLLSAHIKSAIDFLNLSNDCVCIIGSRQCDEENNRLKQIFDSVCCVKTIDKDILYELNYKNCTNPSREFRLKFENRDSDLCLYNISLSEKTFVEQ
ncbi:unnamed protein product [Brachionus calyciflorus]|uniref:Uncharacterized protein n=1 Tax=Brachionus calyciflorus TaxID=104777 RepID=A0A814C1W7_9BILA|nr:unnamed protein product [Brachionus calyciflorus]